MLIVFLLMQVHRTIPRSEDMNPGCIPYLSWREAVAMAGAGPSDPILALVRDSASCFSAVLPQNVVDIACTTSRSR